MAFDPRKYYDLSRESAKHGSGSFRDFNTLERLAETDIVIGFPVSAEKVLMQRCLNICRSPDNDALHIWDLVCEATEPDELRRIVRDITLNLVHEQLSSGGFPAWIEVFQIANTVHEMLTCNSWQRVTPEQLKY